MNIQLLVVGLLSVFVGCTIDHSGLLTSDAGRPLDTSLDSRGMTLRDTGDGSGDVGDDAARDTGATRDTGVASDAGVDTPDAFMPPSCIDGLTNGDETDVDCGGPVCGTCALGQLCDGPGDCASALCDIGVCVMPPSCGDGNRNGSESDIDCGGDCPGCLIGERCGFNLDCASGRCSGGQCGPASFTSCNDVLVHDAGAPNGAHLIDVDGAGVSWPFFVECDMNFDGGGWTLILSTTGGSTPRNSTENVVYSGTTSHMPSGRLSLLAAGAEQVHIRTHEQASGRSVTSTRGSAPIINLRALRQLSQGNADGWTGPMAGQMQNDGTSTNGFPTVFHGRNHFDALHLMVGEGGRSAWRFTGSAEAIEVWIR